MITIRPDFGGFYWVYFSTQAIPVVMVEEFFERHHWLWLQDMENLGVSEIP